MGSQAGRGGGGKGSEREPSPSTHGNNTPLAEEKKREADGRRENWPQKAFDGADMN